ncbi:MAG: hypothetical protein RBS19_08450 [Bacteroidales bacterium]|nr:hypothetical protein [Bacteroidales bacterium]MDY0216969.1 hypothetical protein [Bacteroidales bacterium]
MPANRRTFSFFFLVFFIFYYLGTVLFIHTHTIDGKAVTHSHPYQSDAQGNPLHTHSTAEFTLIRILSQFLTLSFFAFWGLKKIFVYLKNKLYSNTDANTLSIYPHLIYSLRAPPLFFS